MTNLMDHADSDKAEAMADIKDNYEKSRSNDSMNTMKTKGWWIFS